MEASADNDGLMTASMMLAIVPVRPCPPQQWMYNLWPRRRRANRSATNSTIDLSQAGAFSSGMGYLRNVGFYGPVLLLLLPDARSAKTFVAAGS
jgi:hypothetical protein